MNDEWQTVDSRSFTDADAFIRIEQKKDRDRSHTIFISRAAYRELGEPEYIQIMFSKKDDLNRIKLVKCLKQSRGARRIVVYKHRHQIGGGPYLVKRHGMPCGYYIMDDQKIFTWRHS